MAESPYAGAPPSEWLEITKALVAHHPLQPPEILDIALTCWKGVWATAIGEGSSKISLCEVNPPATVVGYFFERLFAKELARRHPGIWRGESGGREKDLHFLPDPNFSVEIKSSGQQGLKIYGNRSYGQELANQQLAKKDKSGYYITVNFYREQLNLVRFGWIDGADWKPQKSAAGQMAGLDDAVYNLKLLAIGGAYTLDAPLFLLSGVGSKLQMELEAAGFYSIADVLRYKGAMDKRQARVRAAAEAYYHLYGGASKID